MNKKDSNFEGDLSALDRVVGQLESGELTLTEALKAFEQGVTLYKKCHDTLAHVENEVKVLVRSLEEGDMTLETFKSEDE